DPAFLHYPGERGRVVYGEGIFVGYRGYEKKRVVPRFAFGHGLSYAEFSLGEPVLSSTELKSDDILEVRVTIRNKGIRPGSEVVQAYIRDVKASIARPEKELAAFARVFLEPGEEQEVCLTIDRRALSFWDPQEGDWVAEPGTFEVLIGRSSADISIRPRFELS
ncbi:MAG: fibronectin type III-like domain-contianing protein, partial [bacterium]